MAAANRTYSPYYKSLTVIIYLCLEKSPKNEKKNNGHLANKIFKELTKIAISDVLYQILRFKPSQNPLKRLICPSIYSEIVPEFKKPCRSQIKTATNKINQL